MRIFENITNLSQLKDAKKNDLIIYNSSLYLHIGNNRLKKINSSSARSLPYRLLVIGTVFRTVKFDTSIFKDYKSDTFRNFWKYENNKIIYTGNIDAYCTIYFIMYKTITNNTNEIITVNKYDDNFATVSVKVNNIDYTYLPHFDPNLNCSIPLIINPNESRGIGVQYYGEKIHISRGDYITFDLDFCLDIGTQSKLSTEFHIKIEG